MVGDTAFYAFRERIQQEIFRNISCFLIVTGLWVKAFPIFGRGFRRVVQSALYVSRGHLELKLIFFNSSKTTFFRKLGEKICHFSTKYFPKFVKNAVFPSRLALSRKWLSQENFPFCCFVCILSEKIPAELSKNGLRWQKNNWGKWFFNSNDLILNIGFVTLNKIFTISAGKIQQGCQCCNLRVEKKTTSGETSFFSNKLSISFYFRILRTISLDIQRKENQDLQNCI